ncbi:hypothetical protein EAO69_41455 [Streptomyces sp. me109]|uniref:hypothetical protein n=1 Tax=Streptomyces sp. me109 TaxID=1827853 RepID=UPI00135FC2AA|nr:hypothetical protein [Streptomyces sp. me109]TXS60305.1 hypothetical protein EAO69_41455 [Streptomyces sp. me109]
MNESVAGLPSIRARYAAVVKDDLELIAKERERLRTDIAALQGQLRLLDDDQAWLEDLQNNLQPPRAGTGASGGVQAESAAEAVSGGGEAGEGPVPPTAVSPKTASVAPTLRDLIVDELCARGRPCSAQDVATALGRAHPGRRIKEPTMRKALEALVGQRRVQRVKRGSRVFYQAAGASAVAEG